MESVQKCDVCKKEVSTLKEVNIEDIKKIYLNVNICVSCTKKVIDLLDAIAEVK